MRILNNELIKFIEAQPDLQKDAKTLEKLLSMLEVSGDKALQLTGELKPLNLDKARLFLDQVGSLEIPVSESLTEGAVTVKAKLIEGKVQLQVEASTASAPKASLTEAPAKAQSKAMLWLEQLKLPKSEHFVEAATLLETYKIEPSADKIKLLAEGSFLASRLNEATPENRENLINQLVSRLAAESTTDVKSIKQMAVELMQLKPVKAETQETKAVAVQLSSGEIEQVAEVEAASQSKAVAVQSQKAADSSIKLVLRDFDLKQLVSLLNSGDYSIDNLDLHKKIFINQEIGSKKHEILDALRTALINETLDSEIKHGLQQWLEASDNPVDEKQLNLLKQLVQSSENVFPREFREQVDQLLRATEQLNRLPDYLSAMHLPIAVGQENHQLEVYYKKRQQRSKDEPFRMLLALDTANHAQVKVLLTDTPQNLQLQFKLKDDVAKLAFEADRDDLQQWIEAIAQKQVSLSFESGESDIPVLEAMKFLGSDSNNQFDARI